MSFKLEIKKLQKTEPTLPYAHTTYWHPFEKIVETNQLKPKSKFGDEKVFYMFYGLPHFVPYKKNRKKKYTESLFCRPIGVVLRRKVVEEMASCFFPFDTGGYKHYFKDDFFDFSVEALDYKIPFSNGFHPAMLVTLLWQGSNMDYMYGDFKKFPTSGVSFLESLSEMLGHKGFSDADSRCKAIEVHCNESIPFNSDNIKAVVFPKLLLKKKQPAFMDSVKEKKIDILTYRDISRYSAEVDCGLIRDVVWDFYEKNYSLKTV